MSIRFFLFFFLIIGLFNSVFIVYEGNRALLTRFNKILKDSDGKIKVFSPGIHFKIPVIDKNKNIDVRIQTLSGQADRFITANQKDVMVDSFLKWQVQDVSKFYLATRGGNVRFADRLLQSKVNNTLRGEFGSRTIKEIVSGERDELQEQALLFVDKSSADLGISIVDVRVKQINLPPQVSRSIFARMREERLAVAQEHRSKGRKEAEFIMAASDKKVKLIIAEALKKALKIKGEGDSTAASIYSSAYSQSPEFFNYYKKLQSYKQSFNKNGDVIVVSPGSKYFQDMNLVDKKSVSSDK